MGINVVVSKGRAQSVGYYLYGWKNSASLVVVLLSVLALSRARSALVVVREAIASDGM